MTEMLVRAKEEVLDAEGKTPHLSYSRIERYLRCPEQYRLYYVEGLRARVESASLVFGAIVHLALAQLFRHGDDPVVAFNHEWKAIREIELRYSRKDTWQSLGEKDRQEFVSVFADLLQRSYISKIERYSGEKITYAGDSIDGDVATVKTRFAAKRGTEVPVDYRMLKRGDRWLVYDVNVEGVSLVANYRTQFNKIIQTASYQELITKMKNSQGEFGAPGGAKEKDKTPRS